MRESIYQSLTWALLFSILSYVSNFKMIFVALTGTLFLISAIILLFDIFGKNEDKTKYYGGGLYGKKQN